MLLVQKTFFLVLGYGLCTGEAYISVNTIILNSYYYVPLTLPQELKRAAIKQAQEDLHAYINM